MKKVTNKKTKKEQWHKKSILTRMWWIYKVLNANWSWRNRFIERRSNQIDHALMNCKCKDCSRSTMFVSKDYWFQVLKGSCQRLLWRIWSYAEKQEPCSRLVTYESYQASGVRTLIASYCQWYDFKYSILVED